MTVSWPTREDILRYTGLVIVVVIVFGAFFSLLDLGLNASVQALIASRTAATTPAQTATSTPVTPSVEVSPVDIQAVTPDGAPADIQVEQVPLQ